MGERYSSYSSDLTFALYLFMDILNSLIKFAYRANGL